MACRRERGLSGDYFAGMSAQKRINKKEEEKNKVGSQKRAEEAGPEEVLGLDVTPESASGVTDADVSRLQDEPNIRPYLVQK